MKVLRITKRKFMTKDGNVFETFQGAYGDAVQVKDDVYKFDGVPRFLQVKFSKKFRENPNFPKIESLKVPLIIVNPKKINNDEQGDYYLVKKKDKEGKFVYNKNGKNIYIICINNWDESKVNHIKFEIHYENEEFENYFE